MPKPWELKQSGGATASSTTPSAKPWELQLSEQPPPPTLLPAEPESEAGFGENFGKGFVSGIYNIGTFMYGAGEAYHRPIVGDVSLSDLSPLQLGMKLFAPETAKSMRDGTADILAGLADQSAKMGSAVLETGEIAADLTSAKFDRGADPESWGVAFGSGAASLLPIVATGPLGVGAAIPTVGLQSFGATYHRARSAYEEQGLSTEEAAQSAMIPALGQASVDMLLTKAGGMLAKKTGATNIEALRTSVRSAGFRDGVKTLSGKLGLKLKAATKGALIEGTIEEAPANFIGEYFIARNSFDPTVTLEQAGQEAWKSWVVGAGLGGGMGMVQKLDTHDDVTAAAREAARRETIRSVAPATAEKLDARDAASLVLPDGEEGVGTLEPVRVDGLPDEGETKPVFPESAREKIVKEAQEKGTLPLWWNRYEDSVGPEDTTVPSGLRHADQATVDRFIEEQEAYNELSQFEIEKHPEFEEWAVLRKGEVVGAFESEEQARDAAREMALKAVPKKTQARIKRYKEFTRKLTELGKLDDLYQSQLDLAKQRTAEAELATTPEVISDEDKQFVAEKLGITVEDLKYSGLNITQEMVNELRYAPEGAGIREFLNKSEQIRRQSAKTPFSELGESRKIQDEAEARAAEIKEERDRAQFEAELISAKIAADSIASDTEMRLGLEREADTERTAAEDEAGVPPALRGTDTRSPKNSQQLGQLAEEQLEGTSLTPTDRTVLNRLLERKANLVADSYGVKDPQQQDNFVQSVVQIDNQIADLLGTERATPATQADLASMQSTFEDVAVEPAPTEPEPEPVTTLKIGDTEIKVVNRSSGVSGVASAARPSITAQQMEPALLKQVEAALVKISKRFGTLLNLSEIQLTKLAAGAGVASIARSGVTDAILVDIEKLMSSTSNKKFSLEKALEEELIHNLDGQALRAEYARLITSGQLSPAVDVRSFIESKYNDIYNNMTADERAAARVLYGNDFIDGVHMAQEFVRQLIQKRHTKTITEESYRGKPIRKLLDIFSRMFSRMGLSGPLQAHVANVESFLERTYRLESKEATTAEAKQRLKEERAERKKLIGKKATDEEEVHKLVQTIVLNLSRGEYPWLNEARGENHGATVADETYDAWRKVYRSETKSGEDLRAKGATNITSYLKTIAKRKANNLWKAKYGTERRGKGITFTSADTLKDEGIEPATFTPAGESMYQTIMSYSDEIGFTSQEAMAVQVFLSNTSNRVFASQLGVTESRVSQIKNEMVTKLRKAADTNPELFAVLIESAQNPQHFIAAVKIASAADPNIREDRVAGLVEAQNKYQASKQTRADWNELNAAIDEFKAIAKDYPQPTMETLLSREQILSALTKDKAKKAKAFFKRQDSGQAIDGEVIDVRIDIPAFLKKGEYVVTFHPKAKGEVLGYDSFVHLTGFGELGKVEFVEGPDKNKIRIATGVEGKKGNKSSFARVRGAVASTTVIPDVTGAEWTQVGFDPERHSYFYNRANPAMRVTRGTEAVSIGNTVFVRNAEMDDAFDAGVAFAADPNEKRGAIARLYNKLVKGGETRNLELLVERYAKESGYTIRASHGLRSGELEGGSFDPERLGSNTGAPSASLGYFFSKGKTSQAYARATLKKDEADEINYRAYQDVLELAEKVDAITGLNGALENKLASWDMALISHYSEGLIDSDSYTHKAISGRGPEEFVTDLQTAMSAAHNAVDDIAEDLLSGQAAANELIRFALKATTTPEAAKEKVKANASAALELQTLAKGFGKKVAALEEVDDNYAARFSVLDTFLKIENPLVSDQEGKSYREESYFDLLTRAKREGHDGAIIQNTYDGGPMDDIYVTFKPNQAKSAKAIEKDSSGEVIPLEKRFDPTTGLVAFAADPHLAEDAGFASKILDGMADIKKRVFRFFDSSGGLKMPSAMNADKQLNLFQPKIDKDAYINSVMGVVRAENRNLKLAIKNELGKATEKDVATINSALNGDAASLAELTPDVRDAVDRMRNQIDGLSRHLISKGWITGDLKAKVEGNLGTYLARSYRIFDEADYTVDDEVKNKAINFLEKRFRADGIAPARAQLRAKNLVDEMLLTYNERGAADTIYGGRLGEKDLSLFMKRKDIAPEIRALLGEYKDPLMNYTRSVSRLANFAGNHRFLTELKKIGMGQIFFEKGDDAGRNAAGANKQITGRVAGVKIAEGEEDASRGSYSPLSGLYTTANVNEILESFERASSLSDKGWWRFLAKANVLSKTAKTVMSVMTHVRNLFGQPYFSLLNGHNPFAYRKALKAFNAIYADAAGNNRESQMYFNKMTRLGLVGEEVTTAELQRVMKDQQQFLDEAVDATELMDKGLGASLLAWKKAKKGFQALARIYRASDELGKIMNFEMEKEALRPIRPDASEAELEAEAAERTRGGIPTYSEIPPAIQKLRMQPFVGPFMSFFYEAVRTQVMNVKYAAQEMSGPTLAHKKYAAKRIGGHLAATIGMGYVMQELFKALSGISDEEEENVRSLMADYEKDGQFIFWRDEEKQIQYINLSFNNPYATTTDQTLALLGISGADDTSGLVDNIISRSVAMLAPFTSETIIAQAAIDLTRNETIYGTEVFNHEASAEDKVIDGISHIARAFTPGTVDRAINKWIPAYFGETLRSGQKPSLADELTAEFTGFKVRTLDYQESLMKSSKNTSRRITSANSLFNSVSGSRASNVSNEDMLAAYDDANESRYKIFQHAYRQIKAARAGGLTDSEITRSMKTGGVSASDIAMLRQGLYRPMSPSPSILTNARKFGHPIPIRDINQLKRKWLRKPLTD